MPSAPLVAKEIAARLTSTRQVAREIVVLPEISSTNDEATRRATHGEATSGLALFAEQQTAGRGRHRRRWESLPHQGLWFSLLLRPSFPMADWPRLTTWAAVGIARGLESALPGCRAEIKWPNDIYLNGKKAAGILIETAAGPQNFAVVGIGLNVNHTAADFPAELADRATSLRAAAGTDIPPLDRHTVAAILLRSLDDAYTQMEQSFPAIIAEAEARSLLLGKWVEVTGAVGVTSGIAEALEPNGGLRLRCGNGHATIVNAGEVTVSRWNQ